MISNNYGKHFTDEKDNKQQNTVSEKGVMFAVISLHFFTRPIH